MAGCGNGGEKEAEQTATKEEPEKIVLRYGHCVATTDPIHKAAEYMAEKVKEKTNGQVEIQVFPSGQLGGEKEQLEGLMAGTHDFFLGTQAPLSNWLPQFMSLDMPYMISSIEQADELLAGDVGTYLMDLLPTKGLYGLGWGENGFRSFTNNKRPLYLPSDMKGLKIRTMQNKLMMDTFALWGADPTPIAFTEVYTALQQKTVDGQETPVSLIESSKFYEVQKYLSLTNHFYSPFILYGSKTTLDKLPEDVKKIIFEVGLDSMVYQKKVVRESNASAVEKMKKQGIEVNEVSPDQIKVWAESSKPIYDQYKSVMGEEIYNKVMDALK
jgi:tripartite ATP-independent transporter DctP family solute receptor